MKKIILSNLILLFSFITNAQAPIGMYPPYNLCDDSTADGYTVFDLTSTLPTILNGLDASIHVVTFHPSDVGALNNANTIANPNAYINIIPFTQTLGIRILKTTTNEVFVAGMNLVVNPLPTANPANLFFCEGFALPLYNLNDANTVITGGTVGTTVTYYETQTDALTGANPVGPGYAPIVRPIQILFAKVTNATTGCFSITTLTLNTNNCSTCPVPTNLVASNITDSSFTFNWTNPPGPLGFIYFNILTLPYGSPIPNENTTGFITVSTNPSSTSFVLTGLNSDVCYSVYIRTVCTVGGINNSSWSAPLNICMPNCANSGTCSQALSLNAFLDSNTNGIKDLGEVSFNQGNFVYQVNDSGNNLFGTTNQGSYFIFDENPNNSYDISFSVNSDLSTYYSSSVSLNNITLPTGSGTNTLYFPIVNTQPHIDASVFLIPNGQPRPGFTYFNTITFQNNGSQTIANGTLTFTKASNVSIVSISQIGTTLSATGFTYNFTNLAPFETRDINVSLLVPTIPTVGLGDLVTNSASIQINGDINLSNNASSITQTIVGSYDPNDKMESQGGKIVHSTFTANDYLYYTIRFENTGTASAEFVRIEDLLNNQLDENTFVMLNASHNVNTRREGNKLTWHFFDINLPPTITNPIASQGFVYFKIKPKPGYSIGDIIPNTVEIYFDYNPAIITNTFTTEFVQALSTTTFEANSISLYPNPSNNTITITNNNSVEKISKVAIYDISGKIIYSLYNSVDSTINIDVSHFSKGMYLVKLLSENNAKVTKKLLIK